MEQYTQKINNVFDHLSALIHQDTKTALAQTIQMNTKQQYLLCDRFIINTYVNDTMMH